MSAHFLQQVAQSDGILVRRLRRLQRLLVRPLHAVEVRQREFGVDHFDVAGGIDLAGHVNDVVVLEASHHMRDRIHFANVRKKLIAQPLALRRAGHQSGDVHEFHRGRQNFLGMHDGRQFFQPRIGHRHHAYIGIDGAEGIVLRRDLRARQCIEQRGFAHVR